MTAFKRMLLALALGVAWCGVASADTLILNCTTVSGPTELVKAVVSCPQINISKNISAISISISGGISGSLTLTNGGSTSTTSAATTTTRFSVGALSGFTFVNPVFTASFTTGNQALSAGQTLTFSGLAGSGNGTLGQNTTSFAAYFGAGFFNIAVTTVNTFSGTVGGGGPAMAQATSANVTAVVTYTYSP